MSRGRQLVSADHLDRLQNQGRPHLFRNFLRRGEQVGDYRGLSGEMPRHNTYQCNMVMADGDFYKEGYGGQGLYISPRQDLVVAFFGSPDDSGKSNEMRDIARQLARSGLFTQ
jgi:prepilin-type processing-associated H-X9-DG protein